MSIIKYVLIAFSIFSLSCSLSANISELSSQNNVVPPAENTNPITPPAESAIDLSKLSITVEATYPSNGANWNDYVLADGTDSLSASDTVCNGNQACIHGGEHKKVRVNVSSCSDLKIRDNLDAFYWICRSDGSSQVTFYSVGLKETKDLLTLFNQTLGYHYQ